MSTDGSGVVGHAGARLLAELAHGTGLTHAYSTAMGPLRPRGTGHDPGPSAADLAVMLVDGGETITDLAGLESTQLELSLAAIDLLAWRRTLFLGATEPRKLRHRLLYVTARLTLGGRRLRLRISATWPWRNELATAFRHLAALPRPVT
ncbi:DDE family transposase [Streptomyces sp. Ag82_O1-15]|uniref:transposase n=1 Tax=Streptomyces sp. Ag82_O1-15 TaxID=1938855 RepID=UPI000BD24F9A|nr:transposase [Streptomyces sp. Ag82_O1-15]PBD02313.1 DDE family transposase [Streptomyces sp. Ag82_O1-15]